MVRQFLCDESGATSIEYALVSALVSITLIGSLTFMTDAIVAKFIYINDTATASMNNAAGN